MRRFGIAVAALVAVALALRLFRLGESSLHQDEAALLMNALGGDALGLDPPVPVWATALWLRVTGETSNFTLRFLPALLASLALWPIAEAARRMAGRRAALVAGALYAVSPFALAMARAARPYGFLFFALALLWLAYLEALRRADGRGWTRYGAAVCLATLCHLNAVQVVGAFLAVAPKRREHWVAAALGCLPAALWALTRIEIVESVLDPRFRLSVAQFGRMEVRSLFGAWLLLPLALYGLWRLARERWDLARCLLTVFVVCSVVTYLTLGRKAAYGPEWTRYLSPAFFPVLFALAVGAASLPARTLSPVAALAALLVFGGGARRALLEKKRRGPLSYEVVASDWWKRHRPDGVVVVGSDAVRVSLNLTRLIPDSAPLYTSVNGRGPFLRWRRSAGRWGMGDLLVHPSTGRPSSGTYLVVAGTGAKAPRICDTLPGAERIAASPARLSLCQIP